jgi:DNA-binding transcriptional regulator YdaS (Cro superfamily)
MKFTEWLDEVEGRNAKVAEKFDVSPGAVTQWRTRGVPKVYMLQLRKFTKGKVSLEEMIKESHGNSEL